jgi:hypothetical protein
VVPQKKGRKKKAVRATARSIERAERTARALELRKGGATYAMIGADLGVSEALNDALTAIVAEPTEKVRKLEIERIDHMLSVVWATATNAMSEVTTVDASLLDMILKAQAGVLKLMERRAKLTGLDAAEKVQEVGPVSDAKASLLAKLKKMAERMSPAEIAAPLKDVTPLIEHEPSADANAETDMIHYRDADAPTKAAPRPAVTPALVGEIASVTVTEKRASVTAKQAVVTKKADGVTKKRGRPAVAKAMSSAERQRAFRERQKAAKTS